MGISNKPIEYYVGLVLEVKSKLIKSIILLSIP